MTAKHLFKCDINVVASVVVRRLCNVSLIQRNMKLLFIYCNKHQYLQLQADFTHQSSKSYLCFLRCMEALFSAVKCHFWHHHPNRKNLYKCSMSILLCLILCKYTAHSIPTYTAHFRKPGLSYIYLTTLLILKNVVSHTNEGDHQKQQPTIANPQPH